MRVLALTKYGDLAASTRQRFSLYQEVLRQNGIELTIKPLLSNKYVESLSGKTKPSRADIIFSYGRRLRDVISSSSVDVLWIHCEMFPYLPSVFESLAGMYRRPIVYDFDDAIFHMYDQGQNWYTRWLLADKLRPLLRKSAACFCGNEYLMQYAARDCQNSHIVPTVVDTDKLVPSAKPIGESPVIGWIGSPSTWPYVRPVIPALIEAQARGSRVSIVGSSATNDNAFDYSDWSLSNEATDIQRMDIGIMPVPDDPWARGKCGYKLLQYMACGKSVIASPVGVNINLIAGRGNGILASDPAEWRTALETLLGSKDLRDEMGAKGRNLVDQEYSLRIWGERIAAKLKDL